MASQPASDPSQFAAENVAPKWEAQTAPTSGSMEDINQGLQHAKLEGEALKEALKKQVEYYLSRHNLATDAFLVSQMNSELYVPISVIANFKLVKALTSDEAFIASVMRESNLVTVDETSKYVKPNFKLQRNTLILRDIPTDVPVEDLQRVFEQDPRCGKIVSIRPDILNTWFVTFETEEIALETLDLLRDKTFQDKPIRARIKSENLLRSFYYPTPEGAPVQPAPIPNYRPNQGQYYPYQPYVDGTVDYTSQPQQQQGGYNRGGYEGRSDHRRNYRSNNGSNTTGTNGNTTSNYNNGNNTGGARPPRYGGGRNKQYNNNTNGNNGTVATGGAINNGNQNNYTPNTTTATSTSPNQNSRDNDARGRRTGKRNRKLSATDNKPNPPVATPNIKQELPLGPAHFPPLSSKPTRQYKPGYATSFKKYGKDEIVSVISGMASELHRPEDLQLNGTPVLPSARNEMEVTKPIPEPADTPTTTSSQEASPLSVSDASSSSTSTAKSTEGDSQKRAEDDAKDGEADPHTNDKGSTAKDPKKKQKKQNKAHDKRKDRKGSGAAATENVAAVASTATATPHAAQDSATPAATQKLDGDAAQNPTSSKKLSASSLTYAQIALRSPTKSSHEGSHHTTKQKHKHQKDASQQPSQPQASPTQSQN
jgi:la-related protein 4